MTWIDWATVACVVYAALLSTLVAVRQQLWIRNRQHRRDKVAEPIQAGDPVYWDGACPVCVTKTDLVAPAAESVQSADAVDRDAHLAAVFGVALSDSQPVDPEVTK